MLMTDEESTLIMNNSNNSTNLASTLPTVLTTVSDVGQNGQIVTDLCGNYVDRNDQLFEFITYGVFLNIIGVLGILGNIISMIILSRPQMRSSINYLLIGLARSDTVLIITSILLFGVRSIYPYTGFLFNYYYFVYAHLSLLIYPLSVIAHTASVYLTVTVTLERFVAVCHPLRARSLCTYGRARLYVIGILIFSFLYNLPHFWDISNKEEHYEDLNITVYCPVASPMRSNPTYLYIYIHWMYLVFIYFLPFSVLAVLNTAIYRQVLKANAERQRLSRLQRREIGLATMLLGVVVVFFACNILSLVANILEVFYDININQLVNISNLLVTINSSVNFIIYVIFGEKFKRLFLKIFCSNSLFMSGRDSPDAGLHDDSLMSNGDRQSIRLHRTNTSVATTSLTRNGTTVRLNGTVHGMDRRSVRIRAPSPGPCVYYPAKRECRELNLVPTQTNVTIVTSDTSPEWENDNVTTTSGF